LTIVIVQNGMNLNAVPTSAQNVIIGAIIVTAVGIDMWRVELARILVSAFGPFISARQKEGLDK
jgi:ribose transport system permease protein